MIFVDRKKLKYLREKQSQRRKAKRKKKKKKENKMKMNVCKRKIFTEILEWIYFLTFDTKSNFLQMNIN